MIVRVSGLRMIRNGIMNPNLSEIISQIRSNGE